MTLRFSSEVAEARANGQPLVALESTIITHGMPYPQNVETAQLVEDDIRAAGAVPATIAVLDGHLHVGLSDAELEALAQSKDVLKLSRADLAFAIATGRTGATTVASTMIGAKLAGIDVFATGGIGGVHRGAELSFDVSADLYELARTPVAVIAAGAKAILDLPKTLELLETLGVPVLCYGVDTFPAFWMRDSELPAPLRCDTPEQIAHSIRQRATLGIGGGHLVANPIPEDSALPSDMILPVIEAALAEADSARISAKDVTPFLLQRIFEATEGKSLTANIALVRNNARLGAQVASELANMA